MKLNKKKAKYYDVKSTPDAIRKIKEKIEWLESHNKNYTNKQYAEIRDVADIVSCFEEV